MARDLLVQGGFEPGKVPIVTPRGTFPLLDVMLGVTFVENRGKGADGVWRNYWDAVGDLALVDEKWGPSIGVFQIRSLRDPTLGNAADRLRVAEKLRDPLYNTQAARVIVGPDGEWLHYWSPFKNNTTAYLDHIGVDYELVAGHPNADKWNA